MYNNRITLLSINYIMNNRINVLDNLRGIAFILMIIQHIPYFYDVTNGTNYSRNDTISNIGMIARTMFIFIAGMSITIEYKKKSDNFHERRFKRSFEVLIHAAIVTFFTYTFYQEKYVRFGILHFMGLATFICSFVAGNKHLALIAFAIISYISTPNISPSVNIVLGGPISVPMMDWFPLLKWLPLMLLGLIFSQNFDIKQLDNQIINKELFLTDIGKNSLILYTLHYVLFTVLFNAYLKK